MSLMEKIFGTSNPAPASAATVPAAPAMPQPGNIPPAAGATAPNNTTVPADGAAAPSSEPVDPLAQFAELWKPNTNAASPALFGEVDPKKLMEAAQKTDFSKVVSADTRAKIQAGGQEGMEAFVSAMNSMSQTVYANSAMATSKIVEQALKKQQEIFEAKLPSLVKQHTLSDTLRSENPVFNNPAVQPLLDALEFKLATKYPSASSTELTAMAKQYIEGVGLAFAPKQPEPTATNGSSGKPEEDWSKFLL